MSQNPEILAPAVADPQHSLDIAQNLLGDVAGIGLQHDAIDLDVRNLLLGRAVREKDHILETAAAEQRACLLVGQDTDDAKRCSLDCYHLSQSRTVSEYRGARLMRQHAYILGFLAAGEETPFGYRPGADFRPGRGCRDDKSTERLPLVLDRSRDEHERCDFMNAWKRGKSIQVLSGKRRDAQQRERVRL